jgi:dienelactone hydrolase
MTKYATNRPLLRERALCGLDQLRKVPNTDTSKVAAIGYCFGGMAVLEMVRDEQSDLAGLVSFHGVLATLTPLKPNTYQGKILVLHCQTIRPWRSGRRCAMPRQIGSSSTYGNALHAFTNWLMPEDGPPPAVYNEQADRRSWIAMQDFFKEIFA